MEKTTPTSFPNSRQQAGSNEGTATDGSSGDKQPKISLPKGGGAIQGIGEKFEVNPVTGTGSMTIPIAMSPGRSGFTPQLALSYDSGAGNSPFGLGWGVGLPSISRKTQKGLPRYLDYEESDIFLLSSAEDLVPVINDPLPDRDPSGVYEIKRYRPRIEGLFARIEKWTNTKTGHTFWKSITKENITTIYGQSPNAQIYDPKDPKRIFQWLIQRTFDDKGNIIYYQYKVEDGAHIYKKLSELNRPPCTQRYLKRVYYGNTRPYVSGGISHEEPDWSAYDPENQDNNTWLFELVFDYGEHLEENGAPINEDTQVDWPCRLDPYSSFRSGFDIRTYRLCRRVLLFHHFKNEKQFVGYDTNGDPIETAFGENYLVRSTDLEYNENPLATKLMSVTHTSYRKKTDGSYEKAGMPETKFRYTEPEPDFTIRELDEESLRNLPQGIDGNRFRFEDLYGEGISGILSQSDNAWYYKPNQGNGKFGPMETVAEIPSTANLYSAEQQLVDLGGDGQKNLVIQSRALSGYYEIDDDRHWKNFRAFEQDPNVNWGDPNLRMIDLTGDGHADILVTEDDSLVWYPSLGEEGFEAAQRVYKALDEEAGPCFVFSNGIQSYYLADMTGDGLIDIACIENGHKIYYWANQGYGHFSSKIRMDNSPVFDYPDQFNPRNIRLADIDGSGTTDIFYLGNGEVRYWHNESGNSWCDAHIIPNFPRTDNLATVQVLDLLGKGTAQLVWSSPLPGERQAPLRYIDLMPEKPHLMVQVNNNMGAITRLAYKASTHFYLEDKKNGTPWITKIPFPVHVLARQDIHDEISGNHFVTRYAYHHGYFDGEEREFRGFGMVEQWDTEAYAHLYKDNLFTPPGNNWSEETDVPPVYTKTWFHTGFFPGSKNISIQYAEEYYRVPQLDDQGRIKKNVKGNVLYEDWLLDDTVLPTEIADEEIREACRALKGSVLRQEVYADDGTDKAEHPYTVTESNYTIQRLQPGEDNCYAVFLVTPRETLSYHYERDPSDPRIAHTANLQVDEFGNITHAASIVYPRRRNALSEEQLKLYGTCTEGRFIHPALEDLSWYRHSLPCEAQSFELTGLEEIYDGQEKISFEILRDIVLEGQYKVKLEGQEVQKTVESLPYEATPSTTTIGKRQLSHSFTIYSQNDLQTPMPPCQVDSLAIPYESYQKVFTPGIIGREEFVTEDLLLEGGYLNDPLGIDPGSFWIPSGRTLFFYREGDVDGENDNDPVRRFYLPVGEKTPLGNGGSHRGAQESYVYYDHYNKPGGDRYYLFVEKAKDPLGNALSVGEFDYRVLQARAMRDINNNRSEVAFDIRGMVIASAIMGKETEQLGDELSNFQEKHCTEEKGHLEEIMAAPIDHIGHATTWFYYDVFAWHPDRIDANAQKDKRQPPYAIGLSREIHHYDLEPNAVFPIQKAVTYSDGFGREILTKVQAEPGLAPERNVEGNLVFDENGSLQFKHTCPEEIPTCPEQNPAYNYRRWVGNGRTIFNNKGKPVKQYEPFFDSGYGFTEEDELRKWGVTPTIHYDPLTRVIQTDFPDGTFSRVEFSPWHQTTYDQNDTVTEPECSWYHDRISLQKGDEDFDHAEILAAKKAALHAGTPAIQHLDTLGRPFVGIAHNRYLDNYKNENSKVNVFIPTHTFQDIEGNPLEIWDGRNCERLGNADEAITFNLRGQALNDKEKQGNRVMTYRYAMGGLQLYQNSMDAGESWALTDVLGNPIHGWSYKEKDEEPAPPILIHSYTRYDDLQRPTHLFVDSDGHHLLVERMVYGDDLDPNIYPNLKGQLILHFDGAGLVRNKAFDFKGNLCIGDQWLADVNYVDLKYHDPSWQQIIPNWIDYEDLTLEQVEALFTGNVLDRLEAEAFETSIRYDALNRPTDTTTPDNSITYYEYNEAGLLNAVSADLSSSNGNTLEKNFVTNIDYNAKGQRENIKYGNGVKTTYQYDEKTFRLKCLYTSRKNGTEVLQHIHYHYDPVGNITEIFDEAQPTIFNNNEMVEPRHRYTYDALYQLICATGRESRFNALDRSEHEDVPLLDHIPIADGEVRNYRQYYRYDPAGNIERMRHIAKGGSWTRTYEYLLDSNRLDKTRRGTGADQPAQYQYDLHGNMTLPHLPTMTWDYKDQFVHANKTGNGELFFTYDSGRQRVRKLFHHTGGIKERIYLGGYEIYREWDVEKSRINEELQTLHIMDDQSRICMVETTTIKEGEVSSGNEPRYFRYQLGNHLGSASIEVDDTLEANIITYEEYHPYGTSSFRAKNSSNSMIGVSPKRYRYTGMERDEETGLNYHTARYYLSWLGRWGSCDKKRANNLFDYASRNPIRRRDTNGQDDFEINESPPLVDIVTKEEVIVLTPADEEYLPPLVDIVTKEEVIVLTPADEEYLLPLVDLVPKEEVIISEKDSQIEVINILSHASDFNDFEKINPKRSNTSFHAYVENTKTQPAFKGGGVGHPELDKLAPTVEYPSKLAAKISATLDEQKGINASAYRPSQSAKGSAELQLKEMKVKAYETTLKGGEVKVHGSTILATEEAYQHKSIEASAGRGATSATWLGRLSTTANWLTGIGILFSAIEFSRTMEEGYYIVGFQMVVVDHSKFAFYHPEIYAEMCANPSPGDAPCRAQVLSTK